ncbi:MAG TPA: deoxyguanosinetriphosphate triphosphohydrolase [Candidatus Paceibacterota bacterium]|nr:deoxyguanosinetriphosphate triphosphohydrolase [Verrucomicrobiota bacterium]HOX04162.1 deoxyguanosinetriphosphate triphosphohydrolase [Verrucomicrobiota bacterium]HRZ47063.1 deoxyguanosinetriphosphate triphosphohydrolase [Candidatus Paceibacterota bacterium]
MPCTRHELEQHERQWLAPFAQFSADTRGRRYPEPPPDWRTQYQRDRDRVIHSRAFRRLEYKTQVFLNGTGDHLRTRLTHTMEVAAIARNIARALRVNEDLAETIALAHDLGHAPYGHKGEDALHQLMRDHGGFEHNRQSLRIVECLEQKYPAFPGLNLTLEVREGLAKHSTPYDHPAGPAAAPSSSLEAQIANLADEIAYYSHDLDDGIDSGLLDEDRLERDVRIWHDAASQVRREQGLLPDECRRYFTIRCLIDSQIRDVVLHTELRLQQAGVGSADAVRRQPEPIVQYSPQRQALNIELRQYLHQNLYFNPEVHEPNLRAVRLLEKLFHFYLAHPGEIGEQSRKRADGSGVHRAVCDYLAGMTDRYVLLEYQRCIGPIP